MPTFESLIPVFESLVQDPESVIRQHVAAQILPVSVVAMSKNVGFRKQYSVQDIIDKPTKTNKTYYEKGYKAVATTVVTHVSKLVTDPDIDVRRSASDALAGLAIQLKPDDVGKYILPIPLKLVKDTAKAGSSGNTKKSQQSEQDALNEDLRITAANLLAELGGAAAEHPGTIPSDLVQKSILPAVLSLAEDGSFRVRRSAAQALPRILGGSSFDVASSEILPAFEKLSNDDLYRVRKSTGECLVDMSRSFMILASREKGDKRDSLHELRRQRLIPIVERLIGDSSRLVRHGMMQFLGPFIASFYPFVDSALHSILPGTSESDGSNHTGIVAQFFPHASSMVSRLNSSAAATTAAPTPISINLDAIMNKQLTELEQLHQALPPFIRASRLSALSLQAVVTHRREYAPPPDDLQAVVGTLLEYFAALAMVTTGDENTDAEMRVYCAYSYPAVALVLGPENWDGLLKTCFLKLLNPKYDDAGESSENEDEDAPPPPPPLPVKRCLASSLHTVGHILGSELASSDIMPIFRDYFLRDSDDSVRLNVFRNFPSLLSLLPQSERLEYLLIWSEIILGEEFLGNTKRSATNPLVLNWRQRDYLARSLPDLLGLVSPNATREHVWPIIKHLVLDSINMVRDDVVWAIPMLLKAYTPANVDKWSKGKMGDKDSKKWSKEACQETITWIKENVLRTTRRSKGSSGGKTNFNHRQVYCRICAATGLALRFADYSLEVSSDHKDDPVPELVAKFRSEFKEESHFEPSGPYLRLTKEEKDHLKQVLIDDLMPPAIEMQDDRIMNVRLGLLKLLELMPKDVIEGAKCGGTLQQLVEEMDTWESFDIMEDENAPAGGGNGAGRNAGEQHEEAKGGEAAQAYTSSDDGSVDSGKSSGGGSIDEGSYSSGEGANQKIEPAIEDDEGSYEEEVVEDEIDEEVVEDEIDEEVVEEEVGKNEKSPPGSDEGSYEGSDDEERREQEKEKDRKHRKDKKDKKEKKSKEKKEKKEKDSKHKDKKEKKESKGTLLNLMHLIGFSFQFALSGRGEEY